MEPTRGQQPNRPALPATFGPAVEDHGRAVTANRQAAAWYRLAQRAVNCRLAVAALGQALTADPAFGLAVADLDAITGTTSPGSGRRQINWERHHIELVKAAATGDTARAADLLQEHLANVGCDPLAARIAAPRQPAGRMTADGFPNCHPTAWR
jgi:DNA-binding GntR family transcriptional regulator